jgi:hypothetical protein
MESETIVQFVWFETAGDNMEFMTHWDEYSKEMRKVQAIKLQQEIGNKKNARYLSQHSCHQDDFRFVFKKERRSAQFPELEMRVRQLGGYTTSQLQCKRASKKDESKIFAFITGPAADLDVFRQLSHYRFLNIYEAYFESSNYNYILEFFVENSYAKEFMEQLKLQNCHLESGMYKECLLQDVK